MAEGDNVVVKDNAATPWYQGVEGVDDAMVGHFQTKGWDKLTPAVAAVQATKAHREVEKMIGQRADHDFIPVPRAPDKGDWNAVWTRLGKPAEAKDYDFTTVARKDGKAVDETLVNTLRETLFKANVPKQYAVDVVKGVVGYLDASDATSAADTAAKVSEERIALAKNWGTTPDALQASPNMQIAKNAAAKLGIDVEAVNKLEGAVGYAKVMDMFRNIGVRIGEANFHTGNGLGVDVNGMMTYEQAVARKGELKGDSVWVSKFLAGDQQAKKEMTALDTIITNATGR